jgi:hypothetical protein
VFALRVSVTPTAQASETLQPADADVKTEEALEETVVEDVARKAAEAAAARAAAAARLVARKAAESQSARDSLVAEAAADAQSFRGIGTSSSCARVLRSDENGLPAAFRPLPIPERRPYPRGMWSPVREVGDKYRGNGCNTDARGAVSLDIGWETRFAVGDAEFGSWATSPEDEFTSSSPRDVLSGT